MLVFACVGGAFAFFSWFQTAPEGPEQFLEFEVKKGEGLIAIANNLEKAGVLTQPKLFVMYAKYKKVDTKVKAGTYGIGLPVSPSNLLNELVKGQVRLTQFTVIDGYNKWQVAEVLEKAFPSVKKQDWLKHMENPALLEGLPGNPKNLEGFLYPETYKIRSGATPKEILQVMVKQFKSKFSPDFLDMGAKLNLKPYEIVVLASIIEKETSVPDERFKVSSVFHNRLKKKMKLQTDPTTIYGMWERYDGNIRKKDLLEKTPYNTYVIKGLPPGPIASPSKLSLEAAVKPDNTRYLYFVAYGPSKPGHYFSKSLKEHNQAVYRYQIAPHKKRK